MFLTLCLYAFPYYIDTFENKTARQIMSKNIRRAMEEDVLALVAERRFVCAIPNDDCHSNHVMGEVYC